MQPRVIQSFSALRVRSARFVKKRFRIAPLIIGLAALSATAHAASPWTSIAASPPTGAGSLELLTDGSVLVGDGRQGWYKLTPAQDGTANTGKYENGTWSKVGEIASSHVSRHFFPSTMLRDGRYLIAGGEFISGTNRSTVDIYDPVTDTWTSGADMPGDISDTAASILPDGRFLVANRSVNEAFIYDPAANAWTPNAAPGKPIGTGSGGDEKGWTLLQNGKVLDAFDVWSVYTPSTDSWTSARPLPVSLIGFPAGAGAEVGPLSLLYSGRALQFGAASNPDGSAALAHTAIYRPLNDDWVAGPNAPDGLQFGDSPAAVMPNGHVLCTTTTSLTNSVGPSNYWEYDPGTNNFIQPPVVAPPFGGQNPTVLFLLLPTGQVLVAPTAPGIKWALYRSPTGVPADSWRPTISSVSSPAAGEFTLTGVQLNGLTMGASFGDDNNMATNYPIVSLVDGAGRAYYGRTYGFDQMAPLPGHSGSCKFTLPPAMPDGGYDLHVSANGVDSINTSFIIVSGTHVARLSGATSITPGSVGTWTVTLSNAAPAGGLLITLASSDTGVATVPASVIVPAGGTAAAFPLTSRGFGQATISATTGNTQFKPATAKFGWAVSSIVATTTTGPFTETVTISNDAPPGGVVVNLVANMAGVSMPPSITIPAGTSRQATFTIDSTTANPGLAVIFALMRNSVQFGSLSSDTRWAWLLSLRP